MATELLFTESGKPAHHHWGIILAGGEGKRLQHFLRSEYGLERPKQYCTILGERSMLRQTIDRASFVIPKSHLLTVINQRHREFAMDELVDLTPENIVAQPLNRETAPGILLPLLHIAKRDPQAVVALFPTDHFIVEENVFMDHVRAAFTFAERLPEFVVTLGVTPHKPQHGYGWLEQGDLLGKDAAMSMYSVQYFWEKPGEDLTKQLFEKGCLWNTLTLVGTVSLFLELFKKYEPALYQNFQSIRQAIGTRRETAVTAEVFHAIPSVNFSHAILERIPRRLAVVPVKGVYWNDWGDESRVREDLASADTYLQASLTSSPLTLVHTTPESATVLQFHAPATHKQAVHESV